MNFYLIPVAEASVATLMQSINRVVLNPLILFMFSVAVVYFLYGVVQYFLSPDDEEVRTTSKSHMLYGIIGIFIMMSVFGIMRIVLSTLGENKIKITDNGEINISKTGYSDIGFPAEVNTPDPNGPTGNSGNEPSGNGGTHSAFATSPFKGKYNIDKSCWRVATYVQSNDSMYAALGSVQSDAKQKYAEYYHVDVSTLQPGIPHITTEMNIIANSTDMINHVYYHWYIAYAPKPGLSLNCAVSPMSETLNQSGSTTTNPVFVNDNPFINSEYQDSSTHFNETGYVSGDTGIDLTNSAKALVVDKIKGAIVPRVYDPVLAIVKLKTLSDSANSKTYFWVLISYPKTVTTTHSPLPLIFLSNLNTELPAHVVLKNMKENPSYNMDTTTEVRFVISGMSADSSSHAEDNADHNAKVEIANLRGLASISGITYTVLDHHSFVAGSGSSSVYHYWIAVSALK